MDDFEAVAVMEGGLGPLIARNDFPVEFHRDAVGLQPHFGEQRRQGQGIGKLARFTINVELHGFNVD